MKNKNLFECTQPCSNCPYRTDAPLKLWHSSEYMRLLAYENDQMGVTYLCHKKNGSICVGWLIKQKENDYPSIMLRIAFIKHKVPAEYFEKLNSPSPLYNNIMDMIKANYPNLLPK